MLRSVVGAWLELSALWLRPTQLCSHLMERVDQDRSGATQPVEAVQGVHREAHEPMAVKTAHQFQPLRSHQPRGTSPIGRMAPHCRRAPVQASARPAAVSRCCPLQPRSKRLAADRPSPRSRATREVNADKFRHRCIPCRGGRLGRVLMNRASWMQDQCPLCARQRPDRGHCGRSEMCNDRTCQPRKQTTL